MLTDGLYRDKDGHTAYLRLTETGYLISYTDGRTIALLTVPNPTATSRNGNQRHQPQP